MSRIRLLLATALLMFCMAASAADRININSASAETLAENLSGIGLAKATAIVAYREQHGPFKTVDDLLLVRGIGEATLQRLRPQLSAATP